MSVFVDKDTRLCVSGITGREGTFHSLRNRDYGTRVVSGVTPGKGGQDVDGIPVFDTFHAAVSETGANTAMVFVPPRFAADSILEAEDAGIDQDRHQRASSTTRSAAPSIVASVWTFGSEAKSCLPWYSRRSMGRYYPPPRWRGADPI